ncbi:hypothetical protein niasHS_007543 [Heterodera schachtii]|uniref:C2H2-type domain-containing protein n=1 Tax=Heterodera schachtii TaxID=97005 RepID=A0ABD2JXT5_HETSC
MGRWAGEGLGRTAGAPEAMLRGDGKRLSARGFAIHSFVSLAEYGQPMEGGLSLSLFIFLMMLNATESLADIRSSPPPAKTRKEREDERVWGGRAESPAAKRVHVEERQEGREEGEGAPTLPPPPCVSSPSTNASRLPPPLPIVSPLTTTPLSSSSSPPFSSPLSTANLFGLFERIANGSFVDANFGISGFLPSAESIAQTQNFKKNSAAMTMDEVTAFSLGINGGQKQHNQQTPATIDKLLQLSQQFLNGTNEVNEEIGKKNGQKKTTNGANGGTTPRGEENGTEREGTAKGSGGGPRGANAGGDGRKRSYPYTFQFCVLCQKNVHSSKLPCHIRQCHVGKPMFQCPVCDFTSTYSKNNVKSHMVSLHGLAGDPISYMDQYATQVEEFMKQCFPNVRGRGRPLHGRQSPNAKHQLTITSTVVSSARPKPTVAPGNGTIAPMAFVQSQGQQRHSSPPLAGPSPQQRIGGRPQKAATKSTNCQQTADGQPTMAFGRTDSLCLPPFSTNSTANDATALLPFGVTDVYGAAMGMLKTTQDHRTPTSLLPSRDGGGAEGNLPNFGRGNGASFGPLLQRDSGFLSAFNPFLYLQQINNLFAVNSVNPNAHSQQMAMETLGGGEERNKMETEMDVSIGEESPHQQRFLEECLNLSQKFLTEMSKDEEQQQNVINGEANDGKSDVAKELVICHSSSPTASPQPSGCFLTSANVVAESDGILREQNRSGAGEADGQSTAATTPNASRRPSNSSAAAISGSVEDELAKIKVVLRQHERRIRLLEDQLADANMANAYGL